MIELTKPQHEAIRQTRGSRVRILDPSDQQEYVLIPLPLFQRLEVLVEQAEDDAIQEAWLELSRRSAADWIRENPF